MTPAVTGMALGPGIDLRNASARREVFHRFYTFHLRWRSHPGCVYFLLPYLAEQLGWDEEQRAWAAWLNGNTQNPVTTYLLMREGPAPRYAERMLDFWRKNRTRLEWDTDRRHQKYDFDHYTHGYLDKTAWDAERYWRVAAEGGWDVCWRAANSLPGLGRLSAWSYLEYVRLLQVAAVPDAASLLLEDVEGSRSHRNGLCLVRGLDEFISDDALRPGSRQVQLSERVVQWLRYEGERLLFEAEMRNPGNSDVGYLTLESALCTYKSMWKPRRRYPGVYCDMLHERIRRAEVLWGHEFDIFWEARLQSLPPYLRLEDSPTDPGLHRYKQDHFRETGQVVMLGHEWPELWSDFDQGVKEGRWGIFR